MLLLLLNEGKCGATMHIGATDYRTMALFCEAIGLYSRLGNFYKTHNIIYRCNTGTVIHNTDTPPISDSFTKPDNDKLTKNWRKTENT